MRVDVSFNGVEFQFPHQCFQLYRVNLQFVCFNDKVVHEINGVPHEQQRNERNKVGDKQREVGNRLAFHVGTQLVQLLKRRNDASNKKRKNEREQNKGENLLPQVFQKQGRT